MAHIEVTRAPYWNRVKAARAVLWTVLPSLDGAATCVNSPYLFLLVASSPIKVPRVQYTMADLNKLLNNIDRLLDDSTLSRVDTTLDNRTMTEGVNTDSVDANKETAQFSSDARQCADELQALDRCVEEARERGVRDITELEKSCADKMDTFWSCINPSK